MMQQAPYIPGLPRRMGAALSAIFKRDGYKKHADKLRIVEEIQTDAFHLPLDAGEDAICNLADRAARVCHEHIIQLKSAEFAMAGIRGVCDRHGVAFPRGGTPGEIAARAVDRLWWIRAIRKAHARRFEHVAIRLGMTGLKTGPYISNESAIRQAKRNRDNARVLESVTLTNGLIGKDGKQQEFTLAELAALGMANKALRRGELMTRIRGFEEIAQELGHVGQFWTITCPSKFHAVGGENKNYEGATPREAQAYLVHVWALIRAKLHRQGIKPYGFRIAEPHTDGCPHWHMLLFVVPEKALRMERIIKLYARYEDPNEPGAAKNRVKLVRIEAGKGTAAGYIAKYVAKNIDGAGVWDHTTRDNYIIAPDVVGDEQITASQRVTYWSQLHGIRQFQQIGGAPVGVWRELRRIKAETVAVAPEALKQAWQAVQSVKATETNIIDGKAVKTTKTIKQASWSDYLRAQGGSAVGRDAAIQLAKRAATVEGRYSTYVAMVPCGVFHSANANAFYESVRYQWKPVAEKEAVAVPWTGVNNCTLAVEVLGGDGQIYAATVEKDRGNAPWIVPRGVPELEKIKIFSRDVAREVKEGREKEWYGENIEPTLTRHDGEKWAKERMPEEWRERK